MGPPTFDTLLAVVLFVSACIGHFALILTSHNIGYGSGLGRRAVDLIQFSHGLLFLAGPFLLGWYVGLDLRALFREPGREIVAGYVALCWFAAFIGLPYLTIRRRRRLRPSLLVSNHTQTVDVAAELGYRPLGNGPWRFMARMPGCEAFTVDFTEKTLRLERLPPEWDGLTILHLTDFHFCGTPEKAFYRYVLDRCVAWGPDLVAFTGDLVDSETHYHWIVPLLGRLRWREGAFAILGNHDFYYEPPVVRRRLGKLGFQVIGNGWKQVTLRGQPLVVIGHEGPWFGPPPDLSACPKEPFRLCLSHTPDHIRWAQHHGIDLMLAGHVHGGQVQLPVIGPLVVPSRYGRQYACGTFYEPPTVLHVGRGLGSEQPLRYNCRPEVTKLVLRCKGPAPLQKHL